MTVLSPYIDVVGVYDTDFKQVFPDAVPIKATINEEATFFKHPIEDSTTRTDHVIFNPVTVGLSVFLTGAQYRDIYSQIKQLFRDQAQLIVKTKTDVYENMYIQSMPHDEEPGSVDSVIMAISLNETKFSQTTVEFLPVDQNDTDTVDRGQQEPIEPSEADQGRASTLSRLFE